MEPKEAEGPRGVEMFYFLVLTNLTCPYIVANTMKNVFVVEGGPQTIHHLHHALVSGVVGEGQEFRP
jgi:hypothetical protein